VEFDLNIVRIQEQLDKELQTVQSGGFGEGVPDDVIDASGNEDEQTLVTMSLSEVDR